MSLGSRSFPDFKMRASAGKQLGIARYRRFGYNGDVDTTTTPETVCSWGTDFAFPTFADTVYVNSTDVNDTSAGTGMRVVRLTGLNADYEEITEDITLNGLTNVTSTKEFLILHSCFGISGGSSGYNIGTVTMYHTGSAQILAQILPKQGQTLQCFGIVPKGKMFLVDTVSATVDVGGAAGVAEVQFDIMIHGTNIWRDQYLINVGTGNAFQSKTGHSDYIALPEKTRYRAQVLNVSSNNSTITANVGGYMIDTNTFQW